MPHTSFRDMDEQLFERLVAYVLDQLHEPAAREVEALLERDPVANEVVEQLEALVEEIEQDLDQLQELVGPGAVRTELLKAAHATTSRNVAAPEVAGEPEAGIDRDRQHDRAPRPGPRGAGATTSDTIVPLATPLRSTAAWWLLAASLAGLLVVGALAWQMYGDRAGLKQQVATLSSELRSSADELAESQAETASARTESEGLSAAVAHLEDANSDAQAALNAANNRILELQETGGDLLGQVEQLTADVEAGVRDAEAQRQQLAAARLEIEGLQSTLASVAAGGSDAQQALAAAQATIQALRTAQADLEKHLAALEADFGKLAGSMANADAVRAATETKLAVVQAEVDRVTAALAVTEAAKIAVEGELARTRDWLVGVADYFRIYARQPTSLMVRIPADQPTMIVNWLGRNLGRDVAIPDLSEQNLEFFGAGMPVIDGQGVALLMYRDPDDRPIAFCFMRDTRGEQAPGDSEQSGLNLVDWHDSGYAHVVVGAVELDLLLKIVLKIQEAYGET